MKCPRCGEELQRSKKDPNYGLCYNCRKKFKIANENNFDIEDDTPTVPNKRKKKKEKRGGCLKIFGIVFAVFVFIGVISSLFGGDEQEKKNDTAETQEADGAENTGTQSETGQENREAGKKTAESEHKEEQNEINDTNKEDYIARFKNQKNALGSLISRYESGEESAGTTAERLEGLADGIQNTINLISGKDGSEDAVSYGTALKGIASHYAQYLKTGDQSEMDDVNALKETIE